MEDTNEKSVYTAYELKTAGNNQFKIPISRNMKMIPNSVQVTKAAYVNDTGEILEPQIGLAVFTSFFCCLPLGIAALIYALRVETLHKSGRHAQAMQSSKNAKLLNFLSMGCGMALAIMAGIIYLIHHKA